MEYTLRTKKEIEQDSFDEKIGMVNLYACPSCHKIVMYIYADSGVTPCRIECDSCGKDSFSQISQVRQPDRVWYRPKNLAELKDLTHQAYEVCIEEFKGQEEIAAKKNILASYIKHYNKGGLFARIIK